jgi:hypothetical protein
MALEWAVVDFGQEGRLTYSCEAKNRISRTNGDEKLLIISMLARKNPVILIML